MLKCIIEIGGFVSIVNDDYDGIERHIVTFCSMTRVKNYEHKIKDFLGTQITLSQPEEPIRFCRLEKVFSIVHVVSDYAERLKRLDYD